MTCTKTRLFILYMGKFKQTKWIFKIRSRLQCTRKENAVASSEVVNAPCLWLLFFYCYCSIKILFWRNFSLKKCYRAIFVVKHLRIFHNSRRFLYVDLLLPYNFNSMNLKNVNNLKYYKSNWIHSIRFCMYTPIIKILRLILINCIISFPKNFIYAMWIFWFCFLYSN